MVLSAERKRLIVLPRRRGGRAAGGLGILGTGDLWMTDDSIVMQVVLALLEIDIISI